MQAKMYNIKRIDKIAYGSGNFGFGIVYQVILTYLTFFATAILDIPGSIIGTALSLSVIWDGFTDPLMGYISDRTTFKVFGRRHLYLLIGSIGIAVTNFLLWSTSPDMGRFFKFSWVLINILLIKTFMTIYATPYVALGAELSSDYNERTAIQGFKTVFFLIGLMSATVMGMFLFFQPTEKYPQGQLNPEAYWRLGITTSLIVLAFGLICFWTTKKYIPQLPRASSIDEGKGSIAEVFIRFSLALKNRDYRHVVLGYLFTNISSALLGTLGLHVFTYTFNIDTNGIAIIFGVQFTVAIFSQSVWMWISTKIDKKPSVMLGLFFCVIGSILFVILTLFNQSISGVVWYFIPFSLIVGFGTGGLFSIPLSMIADTIDVDELKTGVRSEGTYYGCMTLGYKLSQAVAIFLLGIMLDIVRFDSSAPTQPQRTVLILGLVVSVGSVIAFVLAIFAYIGYTLDERSISKIQTMIKNKSRDNNGV